MGLRRRLAKQIITFSIIFRLRAFLSWRCTCHRGCRGSGLHPRRARARRKRAGRRRWQRTGFDPSLTCLKSTLDSQAFLMACICLYMSRIIQHGMAGSSGCGLGSELHVEGGGRSIGIQWPIVRLPDLGARPGGSGRGERPGCTRKWSCLGRGHLDLSHMEAQGAR